MDANEIAALVVAEATIGREKAKDPAAVELGRRGGLKGGRALADKMTPEQRKAAASRAANIRWGNYRKPDNPIEALFAMTDEELIAYCDKLATKLALAKSVLKAKSCPGAA